MLVLFVPFCVYISPRHDLAQQTEYAARYRQQWEQDILQDPSANDVPETNIHSNMSGV